MAERKPAARKPAKRGPTKAAALKALGLTREDLEILAKAKAAPEGAIADTFPPEGYHFTTSSTAEVAPNVVEGSATLHPASELRFQDEDQDEPVWYIRNLRGVDVGFRLTRQQKQGEKRTSLKPRGSRGDLLRLQAEDLRDPELQAQVGYGLVEVIPEGEALEVIKKQYTNAQTQVPAHIAMLRNPLGEEYAPNTVRVASDEEAYGIKVADLNPDLMQGKLTDREVKRDGGFVQNAQHTPTGGNPAIVSDGFMAPTQTDSSQMGNNDERAQQVDALARSKQFEGPGAGLGEVVVKVEPVQRVQ